MRALVGRRRGRVMLGSLGAMLALVAALALVFGSGATAAHAYGATLAGDGIYPLAGSGYDISWPQCNGSALGSAPSLSATSGFGIVGATDGRADTANPCLAAEATWAAGGSVAPTLYMNLNSPNGSSGYSGPAGSCKRNAALCIAYNYGYNAAAYAETLVANHGLSQPAIWWLDIETGNSWSKNTSANAYDIEGAVDYIETHGAKAGVYSTAYQWGVIAGSSYQAGTLAIPTGPSKGTHRGTLVTANWYPGYSTCTNSTAYAGATEWLAQVGSNPFDQDIVCY